MNAQTQAAPAAKKRPATLVTTEKVRGSYVNVFTARRNDLSGADEYGMTILIPKTDKVTLGRIDAAMKAAITEAYGAKPLPAGFKKPVRDGDTDPTKAGDAAYAGCYFLNVKSKDAPGIIDAQMQPVIDKSAFQSGDYCRVSMNCFVYDNKSKGVSFGLNNIQVLGKGEPLSARGRATDDFEAVTEGQYDF